MPALIGSVGGFTTSRLGQTLAAMIPAVPSSLDELLMAASDDALRYLDRKILMPPVTTLTADIASGVLQVPVAAATNIFPEDAAIFPSTGEVVEIIDAALVEAPDTGGAYVGTLQIVNPTANAYVSGATVQIYRQDRYRTPATDMPTGSSGGWYTRGSSGHYSDVVGSRFVSVRLSEWPVWSLKAVFQTLPTLPLSETTFDMANLALERSERGYFIGAGESNPEGTIWRSIYTAGYAQAPKLIVEATYNLLADMLASAYNPIGAFEVRSADQMVRMSRPAQTPGSPMPKSQYVEKAESQLDMYRRRHGAY